MGLDFLRDKEQRFTQQRDKSKAQVLDTENLFTNAKGDSVVRCFHCLLTDFTAEIIPGLALVLRAVSEVDIAVIKHGKQIGYLLPDDVPTCILTMKQNHKIGGFLSASIMDTPTWDNVFTVKLKGPLKIS